MHLTNGDLHTAFFAGLQFASFGQVPWEPGSLTYTSVVLVLPLGTLVAQRLSASSTFSAQLRSRNTGNSSATPSKKRFLSSWSHQSRGVNNVSVQGGCPTPPKEKVDPIDRELQRIDDEEAAGGGRVWVDHEVELRREARS